MCVPYLQFRKISFQAFFQVKALHWRRKRGKTAWPLIRGFSNGWRKNTGLDAGQYRRLLARIGEFVQPDRFAESLIGNIYYDTPDSRLIRTSGLKNRSTRKKLRLRCYGVPADDTPVFAELKKKYKALFINAGYACRSTSPRRI